MYVFKKLKLPKTNLNIGVKLTLLISGISFFLLLTSSFVNYIISKNVLETSILKQFEADVQEQAQKINSHLSGYKGDVLFLSKTPPIQGMFRAVKPGEFDSLDNSTYEQWAERLATIFLEKMEVKENYLQIRYIDETGEEIVRVDSINGVSKKIPKDKLQNKSDRYYFTETAKLNEGEVFVSPLDLNREGSPPTIEVPYKPVIRYGTPLFDQQTKEFKGILIINVLATQMLNEITPRYNDQNSGVTVALVDSSGYFLKHPNNDLEWGSPQDLGTGITLTSDIPENKIKDILSNKPSTFYVPEEGQFIAHAPIFPYGIHAQDYWVLYKKAPFSSVMTSVISFRQLNFLLSSGLIILSFFAALLFSKLLTRPIVSLTKTANALAKGNLLTRVSINTNDEIGILAKALNKMADNIIETQSNLEIKIKNRTKIVTDQKKTLEDQQLAMINILEDVEKEKNVAQHEKEKITTILNGISDGVFAVNKSLKITMFSHQAADLADISFENTLDKEITDVLKFKKENQKDDQNQLSFIKDVINTGSSMDLPNDLLLEKPNGQRISLSGSASPLFNSSKKVIGCVVVFRDASKEHEIDRMKTEFISLASHQLKTPLSAIKWFIELLMNGDAGTLNKDQLEMLKNIDQSNERMIALVSALLNISRIESGRIIIDPKTTNLEDLIDTVLIDLKVKLDKKSINIKLDIQNDLPKINIDPKLIRNVYQNLIDNAIKYSPKKSSVTVKLYKNDTSIVSEITDSGIGIPKKEKNKVFKKFFRAENAVKEEADGNGLGLYLVKAIVESSGGKIWFESKEGEGTTFSFSLPLSGSVSKDGAVSIDS